ncbi:MAG: hypothetical protein HY898_22795 [Deltaproteobacteria bacterium]|nr:hypothetical protein [Deltaproteobacteria bacterium]
MKSVTTPASRVQKPTTRKRPTVRQAIEAARAEQPTQAAIDATVAAVSPKPAIVSPELRAAILALVRLDAATGQSNHMQAVKLYRDRVGCSVEQAMDAVQAMIPPAPEPRNLVQIDRTAIAQDVRGSRDHLAKIYAALSAVWVAAFTWSNETGDKGHIAMANDAREAVEFMQHEVMILGVLFECIGSDIGLKREPWGAKEDAPGSGAPRFLAPESQP